MTFSLVYGMSPKPQSRRLSALRRAFRATKTKTTCGEVTLATTAATAAAAAVAVEIVRRKLYTHLYRWRSYNTSVPCVHAMAACINKRIGQGKYKRKIKSFPPMIPTLFVVPTSDAFGSQIRFQGGIIFLHRMVVSPGIKTPSHSTPLTPSPPPPHPVRPPPNLPGLLRLAPHPVNPIRLHSPRSPHACMAVVFFCFFFSGDDGHGGGGQRCPRGCNEGASGVVYSGRSVFAGGACAHAGVGLRGGNLGEGFQ